MADLGRLYKDRRNALGIASPADQQFARRAQERTAPLRAELAKRNPASGAVDVLLALGGDKQAQQSVLSKVDEGLNGMMMGYTRNGIPHNDPRVVNATINTVKNRFEGTGIEPIVAKVQRGADDNVRVQYIFRKGGEDLGEAYRTFTPEGIEATLIKSKLPEGKKMGVIPDLYAAEGQMVKTYGGEIGGHFVNEKTSSAFQRAHPDALKETLYNADTGKWLQDDLLARYKGMIDFPTR